MTQPANTNRPVDEVRIGRVKATIWRNETEDGKARFNTVFSRLYKDGDAWQSTPSFGRNDLLLVAKVADLAHTPESGGKLWRTLLYSRRLCASRFCSRFPDCSCRRAAA